MKLFKEANKKRQEVLSNDSNKSWLSISKIEKIYRLISEDLKDQIQQCICKYDNVIHSPITDDSILVIDELICKKTKRVGKLLLPCSVRELHNMFDLRCK